MNRNQNATAIAMDRLPPHSLEAEQGALGCCLLDPQYALEECMLKIESAAFYDLRHQVIYGALVELAQQRVGIDVITLSDRIKSRGALESVGGIGYLSSLMDATPSAANVPHYLGIIRDKWTLRKILATCSGFAARVHETSDTDAVELLGEVEKGVLSLSVGLSEAERVPIKTLIRGAVDRLEEYFQGNRQIVGLRTGIGGFDTLTGGLKPGNMYVIAARPGAGKTSLAMNIAEHVATIERVPVGVFSLEMSAEELAMRFLCSSAKVNGRAVERGIFNESDMRRISSAAASIGRSPMHIDETPAITISQFRSRARRMWSRDGVRLFVIDYLQLMRGTQRRGNDNRQQEVSEISAGIKAVAKELKVPVIVLAQLNRDIERDKKRKPRLSDLRESGSIEQDADLVGMLYIEDELDASMSELVPVNLLVNKHRNGAIGEIQLTFLKAFTKFESHSPIDTQ